MVVVWRLLEPQPAHVLEHLEEADRVHNAAAATNRRRCPSAAAAVVVATFAEAMPSRETKILSGQELK